MFWALIALFSLVAAVVGLASIIYPLRFLMIRTRGRALLVLFISSVAFVISALNAPPSPTPQIETNSISSAAAATGEEPPAVKPAAAPSNQAPVPAQAAAVEPAISAAQKQFSAIVEDARTKFNDAPNDLARGATRPARAKAICRVVRPGAVKDWIGTVYKLSSNSDGHGVLVVEIAPDVRVGTLNNAFSDADYNTMINGSSPLAATAGALSKGQRIKFSGRFFSSETDCLLERSITQRGAMTSPDFVFRFGSLVPISE